MIKSVLRSLGLMVLAFGFLMLMQKFGFLRVSEIVKAFTAHPKTPKPQNPKTPKPLEEKFSNKLVMIRIFRV